jgi:hypothetical protein
VAAQLAEEAQEVAVERVRGALGGVGEVAQEREGAAEAVEEEGARELVLAAVVVGEGAAAGRDEGAEGLELGAQGGGCGEHGDRWDVGVVEGEAAAAVADELGEGEGDLVVAGLVAEA